MLFQPSMVGICETGLAELLKFVFDTFSPDDQQRLADNVFITGGCSQLPGNTLALHKHTKLIIILYAGLRNRLLKELQEMRPFQSSFTVRESKNPALDAWFGGKDFANSSEIMSCITTKADYMEKGTEYFKDYSTSNKYLVTPKNIINPQTNT